MKIFMPTQLATDGGSVRAHLLDLSTTGALGYAPVPPSVDSVVVLSCTGLVRRARVMWVAQRRFGVAFVIALAQEEVDAVLLLQERLIAEAATRLGLAHPAPRAPVLAAVQPLPL